MSLWRYATILLLSCGCAGAPAQVASAPGRGTETEPPTPGTLQAPMAPPPAGTTAVRDPAADPPVTDPELYKVVMENDEVRVLRYHDVPGAKTHPHQHPDSVLYALSSFRRRLTFPDGSTKEREFSLGDVMWVPAQTHVGENTGTTNTEVLLVELKRR